MSLKTKPILASLVDGIHRGMAPFYIYDQTLTRLIMTD